MHTDQLFFYIVLLILSIVLLGFLSAAEKAFLTIKNTDIAELKKSEDPKDKKILNVLDKPVTLQAIFSIGISIFQTLFTVILVTIFHHYFSNSIGYDLEVFLYTIIISLTIVKLATFIPTIYSTKNYLTFSRWSIHLVLAFNWLLKPLISLYFISFRVLNKSVPDRYKISDQDFNNLNDSDLINEENEEEQLILKGIANFGNISVKQVMRNRMDVIAIDFNTDYTSVDKKIKDTRYSRLPIYENNLDNIKGILYVKDLLINRDSPNFDWQTLIRPAYFIPEYKKIDDLLKEFRTRHTHIAIVVDEYGGTSGIVTLEDILEEIVGDISDEYDEADDELRYSKLDEYNYVFDGKTPLTDIYRLLDLDEETFEDIRGEADTIGGLVLAIAGRFVFNKEKVSYQNFLFTVESADRKRVKRVKFTINVEDDHTE